MPVTYLGEQINRYISDTTSKWLSSLPEAVPDEKVRALVHTYLSLDAGQPILLAAQKVLVIELRHIRF